MDWTPYMIAAIMSVPGYLSVALAWRAANKLEIVHALVNSQSEKLNTAIKGEALAVGELRGRANAEAEQQAGVAMGKDKEK